MDNRRGMERESGWDYPRSIRPCPCKKCKELARQARNRAICGCKEDVTMLEPMITRQGPISPYAQCGPRSYSNAMYNYGEERAVAEPVGTKSGTDARQSDNNCAQGTNTNAVLYPQRGIACNDMTTQGVGFDGEVSSASRNSSLQQKYPTKNMSCGPPSLSSRDYRLIEGRDTFGESVTYLGFKGFLETGNNCHTAEECSKRCDNDCPNTNCWRDTSQLSSDRSATITSLNDSAEAWLWELLLNLVFFTICTITFWIILVYYMFRRIMKVKNAPRDVLIAGAIVVGLLLLGLIIIVLTSTDLDLGSICLPSSVRNALPVIYKSATKKTYDDSEGRAIFKKYLRQMTLVEMMHPPKCVIHVLNLISYFMPPHYLAYLPTLPDTV